MSFKAFKMKKHGLKCLFKVMNNKQYTIKRGFKRGFKRLSGLNAALEIFELVN